MEKPIDRLTKELKSKLPKQKVWERLDYGFFLEKEDTNEIRIELEWFEQKIEKIKRLEPNTDYTYKIDVERINQGEDGLYKVPFSFDFKRYETDDEYDDRVKGLAKILIDDYAPQHSDTNLLTVLSDLVEASPLSLDRVIKYFKDLKHARENN